MNIVLSFTNFVSTENVICDKQLLHFRYTLFIGLYPLGVVVSIPLCYALQTVRKLYYYVVRIIRYHY